MQITFGIGTHAWLPNCLSKDSDAQCAMERTFASELRSPASAWDLERQAEAEPGLPGLARSATGCHELAARRLCQPRTA